MFFKVPHAWLQILKAFGFRCTLLIAQGSEIINETVKRTCLEILFIRPEISTQHIHQCPRTNFVPVPKCVSLCFSFCQLMPFSRLGKHWRFEKRASLHVNLLHQSGFNGGRCVWLRETVANSCHIYQIALHLAACSRLVPTLSETNCANIYNCERIPER